MKVLLIVHDRNLGKNFFPLGIAYLAAYLRKIGYVVDVYCQDVYHYTEKELYDYLRDNHFDIVGLGFLAAYFHKALKIAQVINSLPDRPFFVLGGHGPSPIPEYMLQKTQADAIVIGEGELAFVDLLEALSKERPLSGVLGLSFWQDGKVVVNERHETVKNLDDLPFPAWDLFPIEHYIASTWPPAGGTDRWMALSASRGCPYRCNFCYRMTPGYRMRSVKNVIDEMRMLIDRYRINFFDFYDETWASSKARVLEFCEAILDLKSQISFGNEIKFGCNGRFNVLDKQLLSTMKEAGCRFINLGLESADQTVLDTMNKKITTEQIIEVARLCKEMGISAGLNVLWGNIGDTRESLKRTLDVLMEYQTYFQCRTFRPPTPYPGSDLYYYALKNGLLKDEDDFFHKHTAYDRMTVNFTSIPDDEFYQLMYEANEITVNAFFDAQADNLLKGLRDLYFGDDYSVRLLSYQQEH